jgi:hypothetical protein
LPHLQVSHYLRIVDGNALFATIRVRQSAVAVLEAGELFEQTIQMEQKDDVL